LYIKDFAYSIHGMPSEISLKKNIICFHVLWCSTSLGAEQNTMFCFRFRVDAGGTTAEGMFSFRVFPAWYWEPLIVANNRTLHVEESTSVTITPSFLKVCLHSAF
jgi:hypothetical protein